MRRPYSGRESPGSLTRGAPGGTMNRPPHHHPAVCTGDLYSLHPRLLGRRVSVPAGERPGKSSLTHTCSVICWPSFPCGRQLWVMFNQKKRGEIIQDMFTMQTGGGGDSPVGHTGGWQESVWACSHFPSKAGVRHTPPAPLQASQSSRPQFAETFGSPV